ncbi:unnamed protein product [Periconia digitata]|uniref:Uncharacterized protein n=1 Tax=Periconia digitata TaxID=1303443 RepID=A0A9W4UJ20_9PLEO|nr:unnamed protein product [Periconia digitata]
MTFVLLIGKIAVGFRSHHVDRLSRYAKPVSKFMPIAFHVGRTVTLGDTGSQGHNSQQRLTILARRQMGNSIISHVQNLRENLFMALNVLMAVVMVVMLMAVMVTVSVGQRS